MLNKIYQSPKKIFYINTYIYGIYKNKSTDELYKAENETQM